VCVRACVRVCVCVYILSNHFNPICYQQITTFKYHINNVSSLVISDVTIDDIGSYTCIVNTEGYPPLTSHVGQLYVASEYTHNTLMEIIFNKSVGQCVGLDSVRGPQWQTQKGR